MSQPIREIEVDKIRHSRLNPRLDISPQELDELAKTIHEVGLLQPIIVRPTEGGEYEVVVGERRFRAAQHTGLKTIRAIVKNYTDEQVV